MATELELLERAKMYIDCLAKGINPLNGEYVDENDVINEVKVSRCLFYVSGVLDRAIDAELNPPRRKEDKEEFFIPEEERGGYIIDGNALSVSLITGKLNELIDENKMKKLKVTTINAWLVEIGMLETTLNSVGHNIKRPTALGRENGIFTERRFGKDGREYQAVLFSSEAQQFIIDNLDAVIEVNGRPPEKKSKKEKVNWTLEKTQILIQLFDAGASAREISEQIGVTENEAVSKINELGLWHK